MIEPTQPARASFWEWIQTGLIAINLAWTTLCLGGFRPETMIVTSMLNGALLAVHLASWHFDSASRGRRFHPAGWWLLPFLAYAVYNVFGVTPVPWLGWRDWLGWAQMILIFWVVLNSVRSTATRTALFCALILVSFATAILGGYQRFVKPDWLMMGRLQVEQFVGRASGSFGIPNSLAALLLLLIPVLGVLTFRRRSGVVLRLLCGYITLVLIGALVLTISRGAWLALAVVLVAWPVFSRGSWQRRAKLFVFTTLAVAGGFMALYFTLPKVRERFVQLKHNAGEVTRPIMWRGAWQIFREHPTTGGGAGSYNELFEKFRPEKYQDEPVWAHNDYVNTLSDYGLVGFVLFFGIAGGLALRTCWSRGVPLARDWIDEPLVNSALTVGAVAFALQLFVDFHFKIPALGMAFAIVTALIVQRNWPSRERSTPAGWGAKGIAVIAALAVVMAVMIWVLPFYRGETLRYEARQAIARMASRDTTAEERRTTLAASLEDLKRAVELAPQNAQAWSDLAYATSLWAHIEPSRTGELGQVAERATDRALAISGIVPEFWIRKGVALDMQGRRSDAGAAFVKALLLAPANSSVWYHHAYHLSVNKTDTALALAAVNFCLRLDPGNVEAQSLRQRLATRLAP